ncbi:hypothetical protein HK405_006857 [Cladochytrium tenue]|nr:hypothetical protein HK405_006857 [Cladochytrium tenue]
MAEVSQKAAAAVARLVELGGDGYDPSVLSHVDILAATSQSLFLCDRFFTALRKLRGADSPAHGILPEEYEAVVAEAADLSVGVARLAAGVAVQTSDIAPAFTVRPVNDAGALSISDDLLASWAAVLDRLALISATASSSGDNTQVGGEVASLTASGEVDSVNQFATRPDTATPAIVADETSSAAAQELLAVRRVIGSQALVLGRSLDALVRSLVEPSHSHRVSASSSATAAVGARERISRALSDAATDASTLANQVTGLLATVDKEVADTLSSTGTVTTALPGGGGGGGGGGADKSKDDVGSELQVMDLQSHIFYVHNELAALKEAVEMLNTRVRDALDAGAGSSALLSSATSSPASGASTAAVTAVVEEAVRACVWVADKAAGVHDYARSTVRLTCVLFAATATEAPVSRRSTVQSSRAAMVAPLIMRHGSSGSLRPEVVGGGISPGVAGQAPGHAHTTLATQLTQWAEKVLPSKTIKEGSESVNSVNSAPEFERTGIILVHPESDPLYVRRRHVEVMASDGMLVKYADLQELVQRITHQEINDPTLRQQFLQTLPTFTTPANVLRAVLDRLQSVTTGRLAASTTPAPPVSQLARHAIEVHLPVFACVFELLCGWMEEYPLDFKEDGCAELVYAIMEMPLAPEGVGAEDGGEEMAGLLARVVDLHGAIDRAMTKAVSMDSFPDEELMSQLSGLARGRAAAVAPGAAPRLLHTDALVLAQHLTTSDRALYLRLTARDVVNAPLALGSLDPAAKKRAPMLAPYAVALVDRSAFVRRVVENEVREAEATGNLNVVVNTIAHMIHIGNHLLNLRNLHSAQAVTSALAGLHSAGRLAWAWAQVPATIVGDLDALRALFSPGQAGGHARLRAYMAAVDPRACPHAVPWFELAATDAWDVLAHRTVLVDLGPRPTAAAPPPVSATTPTAPDAVSLGSGGGAAVVERVTKVRWGRCRALAALADDVLRFQATGRRVEPWPVAPAVYRALERAAAGTAGSGGVGGDGVLAPPAVGDAAVAAAAAAASAALVPQLPPLPPPLQPLQPPLLPAGYASTQVRLLGPTAQMNSTAAPALPQQVLPFLQQQQQQQQKQQLRTRPVAAAAAQTWEYYGGAPATTASEQRNPWKF